ncbi:hypothetical protein BHE97_14555 [Aeromicrobium sp. PE09-221]|uniref:hypothetical protein n=1 Tax=Aeromicrobium sp. PE09-221 TaxID=1898043 RepID=UPI000B3E52D4|nr:hypothetical protein [Aeromicrobium sp. PE09-221]OUZ08151.1 hypothetical protein BHE97_14555 [Aeromicrobium sp. PE09-221]
MEPIGLTLLLLGGLGAASAIARRERKRTEQRRADQLRRDLRVADLRVQSDFHRARRAMNDAAGQSWRNLAG